MLKADTRKPLVLVVDDNPTNLRILVDSLRREYSLGVTKTGQGALNYARTHSPDLILLDVMLPDINGFDVCARLKQDPSTRAIPVIFISSVQDPDQKTRGFKEGGVDFVSKPFHHAEVMARVRTHLLIEAMRRELEGRLSEKRRQLDTLMDNLPGIAYLGLPDEQRTLTFVSSAAEKLTGYSPEHFTGDSAAPWMSLVAEEDREGLRQALRDALAEHRPFEHSYRIRTQWGEVKWVWEQAVGVEFGEEDPEGPSVRVEGFISDITERQKRELGMQREHSELQNKIKARSFGNIIGNSAPMKDVFDLIMKAASVDDNVIVYGESGTGKELVARAIHDHSRRYDHPYVPVNCGAIPETLFESEFFGHKKGAFTGASQDKEGYLARADQGTLFLDELGEISLMGQVKLLRAIEGGGFTRVGGAEIKMPDLRIIAATNRNLLERVERGEMRRDFFYRIHVIPIHLPPLRERRDDIPLLVEHFLKSYPSGSLHEVTPDVLDAFMRYDWPGNIRELQNALYQYFTLGTISLGGHEVVVRDGSRPPARPDDKSLTEAMDAFEQEYIRSVLEANAWHRSRTAEALGVDRRTLFRKMKQYDLEKN